MSESRIDRESSERSRSPVLYRLQDKRKLEVFCEQNLKVDPSCRERLAEIYERYVIFAGEGNLLKKRNLKTTFMTFLHEKYGDDIKDMSTGIGVIIKGIGLVPTDENT